MNLNAVAAALMAYRSSLAGVIRNKSGSINGTSKARFRKVARAALIAAGETNPSLDSMLNDVERKATSA